MADLVPLQDLLTFTRDGEWGKGGVAPDLVKMAVIRGTDFSAVRHGDVSSVPVRYIPKKAAERKTLRPGDILIETAGGTKDQPTGRTVYLNQRVFDALEMPVTCASFARFLRVNTEMVDPNYLFWYLQSIYATGEMFPYHIQHTGVARFQYTDFAAQWRVPVPDKSHQIAIAEILGSLDDKIELNRRMNKTLEAMAQAIFRDWFVDFGPTRRKIDGVIDPVEIMGRLVTDPHRAKELAALFPAIIGDDGLPEGWTSRSLDQIAEFLNGLALQKYPPDNEADSLPVIKIAELRSGVTTKSNRAARSVPSKYVVRDGDFLFSWSGSLLAKFWTEGEGALNQHLFKVSSGRFPTWFYSLWIQHHMADFQQIAASKATTMGHIQRGHLKAAIAICPSEEAIAAMTPILGPLVQRTVHNLLENRTLAATRDLLLPKLMSGEIHVRELGKIAEKAA